MLWVQMRTLESADVTTFKQLHFYFYEKSLDKLFTKLKLQLSCLYARHPIAIDDRQAVFSQLRLKHHSLLCCSRCGTFSGFS